MDNDLVTHSFSRKDKILADNVGGGEGSKEDEEGDKHKLEPLPSISKVHAAYRTVK
jgi:hypothetical protein